MTKRQLKLFLRGMGSVLDIYPRTNFRRFIPRDSDAERLREDWRRVGEAFSAATLQWKHEQETGRQA